SKQGRGPCDHRDHKWRGIRVELAHSSPPRQGCGSSRRMETPSEDLVEWTGAASAPAPSPRSAFRWRTSLCWEERAARVSRHHRKYVEVSGCRLLCRALLRFIPRVG